MQEIYPRSKYRGKIYPRFLFHNATSCRATKTWPRGVFVFLLSRFKSIVKQLKQIDYAAGRLLERSGKSHGLYAGAKAFYLCCNIEITGLKYRPAAEQRAVQAIAEICAG
ncbi:MAG: hypothetical protein LBK65_01950 [Tannerellaceae bacterium]|jgi:hypothetical protein|nr:hypothetical protein [Tannerellaceae bacterium]